MSDLIQYAENPESEQIVLTLHNTRPIDAEDFGSLFSSMASDYRSITGGRSLVILKIEYGSVISTLGDAINVIAPYAQSALEVAKAAKGIQTFLGVFGGLLNRAKDDPEHSELFKSRRLRGVKSAEALLQIATESGSEVELRHKSRDGEELIFKVTPLEIVKIREESQNANVRLTAPRSVVSLPLEPTKQKIPLFDSSELADQFTRIASEGYGRTEEISALISVFATALRDQGLGHVLGEVATKLEDRGQYIMAELVRTVGIPRSPEPPLTA